MLTTKSSNLTNFLSLMLLSHNYDVTLDINLGNPCFLELDSLRLQLNKLSASSKLHISATDLISEKIIILFTNWPISIEKVKLIAFNGNIFYLHCIGYNRRTLVRLFKWLLITSRLIN